MKIQDHDTAFAYLTFHNDLPILRLEEIIQRKQRWQNNLKKHFQFRTRAFIRCSTTRQLAGITGYAQAFCILYRKTPDELKTIPLPEGLPMPVERFYKTM